MPSRRILGGSWPAAALCALLLPLYPALSAAQSFAGGPLTLDEAISLALAYNPGYQQQRSDVDVARSAVRSAYGSLAPSASAGLNVGYTAPGELRYQSQTIGDRPDYYSSDYSLRLSYQLSGATVLQPGVERSRMRAVERRVDGAQAQLEADVIRQYLNALQARERLGQAHREVGRTLEHTRLAATRLDIGAGTPLDLSRAEVQQGQAEVRLVQAENAAALELVRLGQLLGLVLPFETDLTSRFSLFEPRWELDELLDAARRHNPALLAARASADAAEISTRAARSQYLPTLTVSAGLAGSVYSAGDIDPLVGERMLQLQGGYAACNGQNEIRGEIGLAPVPCTNPSDPGVQARVRGEIAEQNRGFPFGYTRQPLQASVGVSVPIFSGYNRQHQVESARVAASAAHHQVRAEELRLRQEVTSSLLNLRAAHRMAELQARVRDRAEEELRLATERFRFGASTSVEITDAQTNLAQAEIDMIEAVFSFHHSLATLEALVGESLRER